MSENYKKAQHQLTKDQARQVDIIITTALIPGRKAPILLDEDIVSVMKPGSVIVDMAAEMGGNCELTRPDEAYVHEDYKVTIVGFTDLLSRMAPVTSELYAVNIEHLLEELGGAKDYDVNPQNDILGPMTVVK